MQGFTLPPLRRSAEAGRNSLTAPSSNSSAVSNRIEVELPPISCIVASHGAGCGDASSSRSNPKLPRLLETLKVLERESLEAYFSSSRSNLCATEAAVRDEITEDEAVVWEGIIAAFDGDCVTNLRRAMLARETTERCLIELTEQHVREWILPFESVVHEALRAVDGVAVREKQERIILHAAYTMESLRVCHMPTVSGSLGLDAGPYAGLLPPPTASSTAGLEASRTTSVSDCITVILPQLHEAPSASLEQLGDPLPTLAEWTECAMPTLGDEQLIRCGHATAARVRWEAEHVRIDKTVYSRHRAELDEGLGDRLLSLPHSSAMAPTFAYLPGIVLPSSLTSDERQMRSAIICNEQRAWLTLTSAFTIMRNCVVLEGMQWASLRSAYEWATHERLLAVLTLQRWFRCCSIESFRLRRRRDLRLRIGQARSAARREWTASAMDEKVEGLEDATLRDVWAEDYETGELGLYFPYRKQMVEVAAERHSKKLYRDFVTSLKRQVLFFIYKSHEAVASQLHTLLFFHEPNTRSHIAATEQREYVALQRMAWRTLRYCSEAGGTLRIQPLPGDNASVAFEPFEWIESLFPFSDSNRVDSATASLLVSCKAVYMESRARDARRVAFCRAAWRQFHIESHRFVEEHRDPDWYVALTSTRVPSAGVRKGSQQSERIPSAGYQRIGSAGYKRLGSAGYDRLGSAGYKRLGSASSRSVPSRLGSAGVSKALRPAPPGQPSSSNCRQNWWEGHAAVTAAKKDIVDAEQRGRRTLEQSFAAHDHYASLYFAHVIQNRATVDAFARHVAFLATLEVASRHSINDEELLHRNQIGVALTVEGMDASIILDRHHLQHQLLSDESQLRGVLEADGTETLSSILRDATMWIGILSTGTEHLKRIGIVPRGPGEGRRRSHLRRGSVLHDDAMESRRKHFSTVASVALMIQRWWRFWHTKPYRVAEAAKDIIRIRKEDLLRRQCDSDMAHVLQSQLQDVSEQQVLARRMLTTGFTRTQSAGFSQRSDDRSRHDQRPSSSSDSMRSALSRRLLRPQVFFVSWASLAAEEATERQEWSLMESLARQRLHSYNAMHIIGRLIEKKINRMTTRHEPANRARIEADALREFVSLFFTQQADNVRGAHLFAKEERSRAAIERLEATQNDEIQITLDAALQVRQFEARLISIGNAFRPVEDALVEPRFSADERHWNALQQFQRGVGMISAWKRRSAERRPLMEPTREDGMHDELGRNLETLESAGRDSISAQEAETFRGWAGDCYVAHHTLFGEMELALVSGEDRRISCKVFDFAPPRAPLPIAQLQCLFQEHRESRAALMCNVVDRIYTSSMLERHEDYLEIVFEQQKLLAMRQIVPDIVATFHDLGDALCRRVSHTHQKPRELEELERVSRAAIIEWQEMQRYNWGMNLTAKTLIYHYYYHFSGR